LARAQWPGNDFEQAVFGWHSELADLKARMLNAGASYAAMSGSGSTLFGLFDSVQSARQAAALLPQNEGKSFICQPRRQAWIP
jgi:4-diphosphocytidyl-2C-methyl-D-erythritol kinase